MSNPKFFGSIVAFGALLLAVLYIPAYLFGDGLQVAWYWMVVPCLLFGLTVAVALDNPLKRPIR